MERMENRKELDAVLGHTTFNCRFITMLSVNVALWVNVIFIY